MAIYQRKTQGVHEGVWYYSLFVDGKRVRKSTGKTNKREAEKVAALAMAQVERGEYRKPVHILLSEFGQKYMSHATTHKRSWKRDEQMLRQLLAGSEMSDSARSLSCWSRNTSKSGTRK
jgi:hypothetical protein